MTMDLIDVHNFFPRFFVCLYGCSEKFNDDAIQMNYMATKSKRQYFVH